MKAVSPETMRHIDIEAIDKYNIPGLLLMENASRGACEALLEAFALSTEHRVLVLCGPGNNGGDGFGLARHLFAREADVVVFSVQPLEKFQGDSGVMARLASGTGVPVFCGTSIEEFAAAVEAAGPFDVVVDALFGTGARLPVEGWLCDVVDSVNDWPAFRFSLDIPTGVDGRTGQVWEPAFRADATATLGLAKVGLFCPPGSEYCGEVRVVDLGIPREVTLGATGVDLLRSWDDLPGIPERPKHAYKHMMGHFLLVGGSPGRAGAALLGGQAGLRTGAGLVTLAVHGGARGTLEGIVADLMVEGLDMDHRPSDELGRLLAGKSAAAAGPGLGTCQEAWEVIEHLLARSDLPLLLDADALTMLGQRVKEMSERPGGTVLTPHPGEMARLLDVSRDAVQADRISAAMLAAERYSAVVVLKGAATVIAEPGGKVSLCLAGSPSLAKAGTGDVLTGIIGGLMAMGMGVWDAARVGVFAHARGGEILEQEVGIHGATASDLLGVIPRVFEEAMS